MNGQKEVGLQMVWILNGIWNLEVQPFEIQTNFCHFSCPFFRIFTENFSVFPKNLPDFFCRKEFPENWEFQQKTENYLVLYFIGLSPGGGNFCFFTRSFILILSLERCDLMNSAMSDLSISLYFASIDVRASSNWPVGKS